MKFMKRRGLRMFAVAALLPLAALHIPAQTSQGSAAVSRAENTNVQQVTALLNAFLAAVPKGDRQVFDNFFADDVIYTRAVGVTVGKSAIMEGVGTPAPNEPVSRFEADDITVHPYGEMVVVNFRLVQHKDDHGKQETLYYRNTGTFLRRNGKWQVVAWQATRVPEPEAQPKA